MTVAFYELKLDGNKITSIPLGDETMYKQCIDEAILYSQEPGRSPELPFSMRRVGALIYDEETREKSLGRNEFRKDADVKNVSNACNAYTNKTAQCNNIYGLIDHAEVKAIQQVSGGSWTNKLMFVSLFPCLPCTQAVASANPRAIIINGFPDFSDVKYNFDKSLKALLESKMKVIIYGVLPNPLPILPSNVHQGGAFMKTNAKVIVGNRTYCVYKGQRGVKFIRRQNQYVKVKDVLK